MLEGGQTRYVEMRGMIVVCLRGLVFLRMSLRNGCAKDFLMLVGVWKIFLTSENYWR